MGTELNNMTYRFQWQADDWPGFKDGKWTYDMHLKDMTAFSQLNSDHCLKFRVSLEPGKDVRSQIRFSQMKTEAALIFHKPPTCMYFKSKYETQLCFPKAYRNNRNQFWKMKAQISRRKLRCRNLKNVCQFALNSNRKRC